MIPHNKPTLGREEEEAAVRALRSGWVAQGKEVRGFEDDMCSFLGLPAGHAVAVSSGTAALFLALTVLKARGRNVAFPAYACSALKNACAMSGGIPVLLDNEEASPNVDLQALAGSRADIAIVPHMFGIPTVIPHYGTMEVIEDCAQALGACVENEPVGLRGIVGVYSFFATKMITSGGQGGMLISRDINLIDEIRDYREFDCRRDRKPRFNFQMTDLQAAVGRAQLRKLPDFINRRREIFERYVRAGLDLMDPVMEMAASRKAVRFRAVLKTDKAQAVIDLLAGANIKAIVPLEEWELLGPSRLYPQACKVTKTTVSLPIYPSLTNKETDLIISILRKGALQ